MDNFDKLLDVAHVLARVIEGENTPTEATSPPAEKPDISGKLKYNVGERIRLLNQALANLKTLKRDLKDCISDTHKYCGVAYSLREVIGCIPGFEREYKDLSKLHTAFNNLHMELKEKIRKGELQ